MLISSSLYNMLSCWYEICLLPSKDIRWAQSLLEVKGICTYTSFILFMAWYFINIRTYLYTYIGVSRPSDVNLEIIRYRLVSQWLCCTLMLHPCAPHIDGVKSHVWAKRITHMNGVNNTDIFTCGELWMFDDTGV